MNIVLFLCTGNYYRSRFAETLFNHVAEGDGLPWRAVSRGLRLAPDRNPGPLSVHARTGLERLGVPVGEGEDVPFPSEAVEADFAAAHHVVAVKEAEHRPMIADRFPAWEPRVEFWSVHDVDCATPDEALPLLERRVRNLARRLRTARSA